MQQWTELDEQCAATEGWGLADIIDNGDVHVYLLVYPADKRFKNTFQATAFVIERSRTGSVFHQRAMRLMAVSRLRPTKKRNS